MKPQEIPTLPEPEEFIRVVNGPKVDIYVGPKRKHYSLPKELLSHYSQYFNRCFNGNFAEAKTQTLELPEDDPHDFAILVQYMLHGTFLPLGARFEDASGTIERCMRFVEYADKYDLGNAAQTVCALLKSSLAINAKAALKASGRNSSSTTGTSTIRQIQGEDIELVFRTMPVGNPLRKLIVQGAILAVGGPKGTRMFRKQEEEVDGYAAELLAQLREGCKRGARYYDDPITEKAYAFEDGI